MALAIAGATAICGCEATNRPVSTVGAFRTSSADEILVYDGESQALLRMEAVEFLTSMATHEQPSYRAHAIEAMQAEPIVGEELARAGLLDDNVGVRFAATMSIGQAKYASASTLVHALVSDPDPSVRGAAIYARRANGHDVDLSPLARMLRDPDWRVRANAALILGELGDPSAIRMLHDALQYRSPRTPVEELRLAELQIAEALVKLGDEDAIDSIRAPLYARDPNYGEIMAFAAATIGRVKDYRSKGELIKIVAMRREYRNSAEVRLAAMASLAQLGEPVEIGWVLEYLGAPFAGSDDPRYIAIQAQAAHVLGEIGQPVVLPALNRLLSDESNPTLIRLHAAAAILKTVQ